MISNLILLDPDAVLRVRFNGIHIRNVHDETVTMMYDLLHLVEICVFSIFLEWRLMKTMKVRSNVLFDPYFASLCLNFCLPLPRTNQNAPLHLFETAPFCACALILQ